MTLSRRDYFAAAIASGYLAGFDGEDVSFHSSEIFASRVREYTDALISALGESNHTPTFPDVLKQVKQLNSSDLEFLYDLISYDITSTPPPNQRPYVADEQALMGINHLLDHCSREAIQRLQTVVNLRLQQDPTDEELIALLGDRGGITAPPPWELDESDIPTVILPNE